MCRSAMVGEVSRLSRLQHAHLVRLLAACHHAGSPAEAVCGIVLEYPRYGDLKRYLRQHATAATAASTNDTLSSSGLTLVTRMDSSRQL